MRHKHLSSLVVLIMAGIALMLAQTALAAEQKVEFAVPGVT
jgi:hypothetical protein